jgi:hypothetical protein
MLGDIQVYDNGAFGYPGADTYNVASGVVSSIKAGEPVMKLLGDPSVVAMTTNMPNTGSAFLVAGIAETTSTDTASAAGIVKVLKMVEGQSFLIAPKVAATWDTQSEYDALVGDRVLLDLTGTLAAGTQTYTILAADSANYGCVVLPLDVQKYPNKVRFAFRNAVNYLA